MIYGKCATSCGSAVTGLPVESTTSIPFLEAASRKVEMVDQQEMYNLFRAQGKDLFSFVADFEYKVPMDDAQKLVLFCQLATLNPDGIQLEAGHREHSAMTIHEKTCIVEHSIIYPK